MKDGQRLIVKVIKSEEDLPKEGTYYCFLKSAHQISLMRMTKSYSIFWMEDVDWYLQPIEITDSDIEAWAAEKVNEIDENLAYGDYLIAGAKAYRDNEIKHKE
jgi:hypothetical protein